MAQHMRAKEPFAVEIDGVIRVFNPETILRGDDDIVKQYPDRFVPAAPAVETATAAPGESRNARR